MYLHKGLMTKPQLIPETDEQFAPTSLAPPAPPARGAGFMGYGAHEHRQTKLETKLNIFKQLTTTETQTQSIEFQINASTLRLCRIQQCDLPDKPYSLAMVMMMMMMMMMMMKKKMMMMMHACMTPPTVMPQHCFCFCGFVQARPSS
jgi:hypothetical protein